MRPAVSVWGLVESFLPSTRGSREMQLVALSGIR